MLAQILSIGESEGANQTINWASQLYPSTFESLIHGFHTVVSTLRIPRMWGYGRPEGGVVRAGESGDQGIDIAISRSYLK